MKQAKMFSDIYKTNYSVLENTARYAGLLIAPATLSQGGLQPQWRALQDILNYSFIC